MAVRSLSTSTLKNGQPRYGQLSVFLTTLPKPANFSNTATGTVTEDFVNYKYVSFTTSGTLTITTEGFAEILSVGGGGGAGLSFGCPGGGGGVVEWQGVLPTGSYTVVVGAGGASRSTNGMGNQGSLSRVDTPTSTLVTGALGGGGGFSNISTNNMLLFGASAGGSYDNNGNFVFTQGNNADDTVPLTGGELAPSGGAGSQGIVATRLGGLGKESAITGTLVAYAPGGRGAASFVYAAQRPAAPGAAGDVAEGAAGTNGIVIVRVRV